MDYARGRNYTFARSRDSSVRTIEDMTTDGAVTLASVNFTNPLGFTVRNLYVMEMTTASYLSRHLLTVLERVICLTISARYSVNCLLPIKA